MSIKRQWIRIVVPCDSDYVDDLSAELAQTFTLSVEIIGTGVCFYLQEEGFFDEGREKLERILSDFKKTRHIEELLMYSFSSFAEEDWLEKWKVNFKPLRVGMHWVIAPTWDEVHPGLGDKVIRIDPGRAFGTGHHETTRLCLEWLEEWSGVQRDASTRSLLDVGTGSGILAIAAVLLGFLPVAAVDNDPEAIEVARENMSLNGVDDRIVLLQGTVAEVPGSFDVVMANIQALPLIEMAGCLVPRLRDSARLVLSGILMEQRKQVQTAYEAEGLKFCGHKSAGEWCLLVFIKELIVRS